MDIQTFKKVFSQDRTQRYLDKFQDDEDKAMLYYKINLQISEAFYPILSILEVALRNSLNRELTKHFGTTEWHTHIAATIGLKGINQEITNATRFITKRGETINSSKIVSELTLGFWVRVLNVEYEKILWKSLRLAFPYLPKQERKRHRVSVPLNNIRNFRNRVYHNEPIAWNFDKLVSIYDEINEVLGWLNSELPQFAKEIGRFELVMIQAKKELGYGG